MALKIALVIIVQSARSEIGHGASFLGGLMGQSTLFSHVLVYMIILATREIWKYNLAYTEEKWFLQKGSYFKVASITSFN